MPVKKKPSPAPVKAFACDCKSGGLCGVAWEVRLEPRDIPVYLVPVSGAIGKMVAREMKKKGGKR